MEIAVIRAWLAARAGQLSTLQGALIMLIGGFLYHKGVVVTDLADLGFVEAVGALCIAFRETPRQAIAQLDALLAEIEALRTALPPAPDQTS